jgi:hypothetical protein
MFARSLTLPVLVALFLAFDPEPALAQDAQICFDTADNVTEGVKLGESENQAAHEACQRALAQTSSVVQKYHLQEADFDITGTRPKD